MVKAAEGDAGAVQAICELGARRVDEDQGRSKRHESAIVRQ
jgi:hypothetical protein